MKLSINSNIRRLGIFVFYDKNGHANEYIKFFLSDLIVNFHKLVIISNGNVDYETYKYFSALTSDFFVRENKGLDAAAYKMGMLAYVGWDELGTYDEVVLLNDTCYGPIHSFEKIFYTMDCRDLDFWGISAGYKSVDGWNSLPQGFIPDHIQTFFMAFRKEMIMSDIFREYWINYNSEWNTFFDVVTRHELLLTDYFSSKGFVWDVYVDIGEKISLNINKNCNLNGYAAYLMIHDFHSPLIKRKSFAIDRGERLHMAGGEDMSRAMEFLQERSDYDISLIYKDLIKRYNIWDLYDSMNMNYIFSDTHQPLEGEKKYECLITIYCENLSGVKKCIPFLKNLEKTFDIIILLSENTNIDEIKRIIEVEHILLLDIVSCAATTKGIAALWLISEQIKAYKFLCFTHDAVYYWGDDSDTIYESIFYTLQENTIKSAGYIINVLDLMKKNPAIGLLLAPFMLHNKYYHSLCDFWEDDFTNIEHLANILQLNCQLDSSKPGISRGGAFICKTEVLEPVLKWNITGEDYLKDNLFSNYTPQQWEKIIPFLAQDQNYLTGVMMNEKFASVYITNLKYYLQDLLIKVTPLGDNSEMSYSVFSQKLLNKIDAREIACSKQRLDDLNYEIENLKNVLKEKEQVIQILFPLTSLKKQLRLRMKKYLPRPLYRISVCLKRLVLGPRNIQFNYND